MNPAFNWNLTVLWLLHFVKDSCQYDNIKCFKFFFFCKINCFKLKCCKLQYCGNFKVNLKKTLPIGQSFDHFLSDFTMWFGFSHFEGTQRLLVFWLFITKFNLFVFEIIFLFPIFRISTQWPSSNLQYWQANCTSASSQRYRSGWVLSSTRIEGRWNPSNCQRF